MSVLLFAGGVGFAIGVGARWLVYRARLRELSRLMEEWEEADLTNQQY